MKKVDNISEELRGMGSVLADMSRVMPYSVPDGFFENFANSTRGTIKDINQAEQVPAWGKALPYRVPVHYFESLTEDIVAAVVASDFRPVGKGIPFATPVGYFDSLPASMLIAAKASDVVAKPRVIALKYNQFQKAIKWAAAAMVVLGIGLGSMKMYFNSTVNTNPEQILASVPGNEIQDYLQHTYRFDIDKTIDNSDINNMQVDTKDIVQYLDETGWDATE